jgi:hypothetical protein
MAISSNPARQKIESICSRGFISGEELQKLMTEHGGEHTIKTSYDIRLRNTVPLNCISNRAGIIESLYHFAKGGLTVMIEERVGDNGILDEALQRNALKIEESKKVLSSNYPSLLALGAARSEALSNDRDFLQQLSQKCHQTVLFVLDLEMEKDENTASDGCFETGRKFIPPTKIQGMIISRRYEQESINISTRKVFVDSIPKAIVFCYKDGSQTFKINIIRGILIPNYEAGLSQFTENRELSSHPLYTHMTRLY